MTPLEARVGKIANMLRYGFDQLQTNVLQLYKRQAAPPNPSDGAIWYRTDTRRFQARAALGTGDLPVVIARSTTAVSVTNTVTDTTIVTFTVPANTLHTDRVLRLTVLGRYLNNSGATDTFKVTAGWGGTGYIDTTAAVAASATRYATRIVMHLFPANDTAAQRIFAEIHVGNAGTATAGSGDLAAADFADAVGYRGQVQDSTTDQTVAVKIQHTTANANISFTMDGYWAEVV